MEDKKKISIILPVYNGEKTIAACLDSIKAQTYTGWNVILVNDGSSDRTKDICDRYAEADERIKVYHRTNGGVSAARNFAIDQVDTEFFVCVDSDDTVSPDYLMLLLETRDQYPQVGHIWCAFQAVEDQNNTNPVVYRSSEENIAFFDRDQLMSLHKMWLVQMPWNRLFETETVNRNRIRMDENLSLGEDFLFHLAYLDACEKTGIAVINRPYYNYVQGTAGSLDNRFRFNLKEIYEILNEKTAEYLKKWGVPQSQWDIYYDVCFYHYEKVLRNSYHKDNPLTEVERRAYNDRVLKSQNFQTVLRKRTCFVHPMYLWAYSTKQYRAVQLVDRLVNIKKKLRRRKRGN